MELLITLKNSNDTLKIMRYLNRLDTVSKVYLQTGSGKKIIDVRNKEFLETLSISGAEAICKVLPKEEEPHRPNF